MDKHSEATDTSIFRHLWLRILIVAACAGWTLLEFLAGETSWTLIAAAVTAYGVWSFLIAYRPAGSPGPTTKPD